VFVDFGGITEASRTAFNRKIWSGNCRVKFSTDRLSIPVEAHLKQRIGICRSVVESFMPFQVSLVSGPLVLQSLIRE
jgi:hypothetical protein